MQFDIASGTISPFANDVQSFVTVGDSVYLLQFVPVPFSNLENPHKLKKWTMGNVEPQTLIEGFKLSNGSPNLQAFCCVKGNDATLDDPIGSRTGWFAYSVR